jgi:hypothetical protein
VGVAEIAEILGVSRQRVNAILKTVDDFPQPEVVLTAGRIWQRETVEAWCRRRGYLPSSHGSRRRSRVPLVTSRSFNLPDRPTDMNGSVFFNLWERKRWPYDEVQSGSTVYWYETRKQWIRWKTKIAQVEAVPYDRLDDAIEEIEDRFGTTVDRTQPYVVGKPNKGFCLAYRVADAQRVDLPKPEGTLFSQLGWERGDRPEIEAWIGN